MNKFVALIFAICIVARAKAGQHEKNTDLKTQQVLRAATADLPGKNYRVVFAAEDSQESMNPRHWMVTIQKYPADYNRIDDSTIGIMFTGPPCPSGKAGAFCSIQEIPGEPLFRGRFDHDDAEGHFRRFEGNILDTASRMTAFRKQLMSHQKWSQHEIADALNSEGAKFGPDKEKELRATLPNVVKMLEKAFGPMQIHKVSSMKPVFLTLPSKDPALIGWPAYWSVSTILLHNPKERLVMYFDPFEGQLQSLFVSQGSTVLDPKTHKPKWVPPND
ncbi:MAG TPA: hypothetical protein VGK22_06285 [Candidatus Angelobacter sp.]|jgi:hypothetical protein